MKRKRARDEYQRTNPDELEGTMSVHVFESMIGATLKSVDGHIGSEEMTFAGDDGRVWRFYYEHDCCASCTVEDVCGDLVDLVGSPILEAEEVTSYEAPAPIREYGLPESFTWTFYRFATAKGSVTVRWLGESNGYYSESVTYTGPEGTRYAWESRA